MTPFHDLDCYNFYSTIIILRSNDLLGDPASFGLLSQSFLLVEVTAGEAQLGIMAPFEKICIDLTILFPPIL